MNDSLKSIGSRPLREQGRGLRQRSRARRKAMGRRAILISDDNLGELLVAGELDASVTERDIPDAAVAIVAILEPLNPAYHGAIDGVQA